MNSTTELLIHDAEAVCTAVVTALRTEIVAGRVPMSVSIGLAAALHQIREHCPACQHMIDYGMLSYYDPPPEEHATPPDPTDEAYVALYGTSKP